MRVQNHIALILSPALLTVLLAAGGAPPRNVALVLEKNGSVAIEGSKLAVRPFARLRSGIELDLKADASLRLMFPESGVTELWKGPARLRLGETQGEPADKDSAAKVNRTRPPNGPNEAAGAATLVSGPNPAELARPGGVRVRNAEKSPEQRVNACKARKSNEGETYASLCLVGVYVDSQRFAEATAVIRELEARLGVTDETVAMLTSVRVAENLARAQSGTSAPFVVDVWIQTTDGRFVVDGGELEIGTEYEIHATCSHDCYLRVVGETPDAGVLCQYSPSRTGESAPRLKAGEDGARLINPQGAVFAVGEPAGLDDVIAVQAVPAEGGTPFGFVEVAAQGEPCVSATANAQAFQQLQDALKKVPANGNAPRAIRAEYRFRAMTKAATK